MERLYVKTTLAKQRLPNKIKNIRLEVTYVSGRLGFWLSRDGDDMEYLDGSPDRSASCACNREGDCADTNKLCNCDVTDGQKR